MKKSKVSLLPLKLLLQVYKNFLPQLYTVNSCWGNYLWWPLSPFLNYLLSRQKLVQPALHIPTSLTLRLTIQRVLLLLGDHLPSDSGLLVTVSWLLSILFDLTGFCVSKSFVAQLLTKKGSRINSCALMAKAPFLLFSLYELHFEIHWWTNF